MGPTMITPGHCVGFPCFIDQLNLEKSSYLKDDCLKIECMVGVVLSSSDTELMDCVPRCDNVGISLLSILSGGEGADVVFKVRGTKFSAHKPILAQRSSYFQSMFATEFVPHGQEIIIDSTEPRVFKALLHFIYSDTLPEDDKTLLETGYALGPSVSGTFAAKLFVASAQYGLGNSKSISEHYVWISMSVVRFPETLHLADINDASSLKHLCFKYAMDNFQALVEHNSFDYLRQHCPSLLNEVYDIRRKGFGGSYSRPIRIALISFV